MISVEEAEGRILAALSEMPAETVSLAQALGRVSACEVVSRLTQPPADVSAMDGYAVRADDLAQVPVDLQVIGEAPAGTAFTGRVRTGQAVRIFTGGPVPDGADAIVIQENIERDGERISVRESVAAGTYVRPAGLDFTAGEPVIPAGTLFDVRTLGLAAAMNVPWLSVRRKPRIAVLATGDEIVMPGDPLGAHQIVSSNGLALGAFISAFGGEPVNLGIAPDDPAALEALIAAAAGADLIVTSGGASVGDRDLVSKVLGEKRMDVSFWKIAMRPGKPLIFGRIDGTLLLGMPGNPVSAIVCSLVFLRPALYRMLGLANDPDLNLRAELETPLPRNDHRQDYLRANLATGPEGPLRVRPFARQDSSMLRTLSRADCLIVRPPFAEAADAGASVEVLPLRGGLIRI
jgi:molybdopterin molybdotransferase